MNFDMVQKSLLAFAKVSELNQMGILYQTESFLTVCISLGHKLQQTSRDWDNSRHVRTHENNSLRCVRRLGTIIQSIFCAQSGADIRLNFWKWSIESRYPGALSPVMKTFIPPFLPAWLTAPGSPRMPLIKPDYHFTSSLSSTLSHLSNSTCQFRTVFNGATTKTRCILMSSWVMRVWTRATTLERKDKRINTNH